MWEDMTGEGECGGDMTGEGECGGDMSGEGECGETWLVRGVQGRHDW